MRLLRRFPVVMAALMAMSIGLARPAAAAKAAVLHATLSGASEVPGPGDPGGQGTALIVLDAGSGRVCYVIRVSGLSSPPTAAHIHAGPAGVAGPVVVPLPLMGSAKTIAGCTTAAKDVVQGIIADPTAFYVNVHTADFPGGATRGQLSPKVALR